VLWRDIPFTRTLSKTLNPRSFASANAEFGSRGFHPQFLTPIIGAGWDGYYSGWIRQELPNSGGAVPSLAPLDRALEGFLRERGIRGATMAVAKGHRVLVERGFGYADRGATRPMAPGDPMRLASLSKAFTAAAVRKLIERGRLLPDSSVVELLDLKPPPGRTMDPRLKKVTVQHVLDHRGGWRTVNGWEPMFATDQIATALGRLSPASASDIVDYMAGQPLQFDPGTEYSYSNFGYCLLGRVIERVAGRSYIDDVRAEILEPLGIKSVSTARSRPHDRNACEPDYVHPGSVRSLFDADAKSNVPEPNGGFAIEALDSSGGLIASAADVALLLSHYGTDGRRNPPHDERQVYLGTLPGTFTMALRLPGGIVVVVLCNQSVPFSGLPMNALAGTVEDAIAKVQTWPTKQVDLR
jgi:CubicO group peptidase (beta-lactamase class C family)